MFCINWSTLTSNDVNDRLNQIGKGIQISYDADIIRKKLKNKEVITENEKKIISKADKLADKIIQVDSFEKIGDIH